MLNPANKKNRIEQIANWKSKNHLCSFCGKKKAQYLIYESPNWKVLCNLCARKNKIFTDYTIRIINLFPSHHHHKE